MIFMREDKMTSSNYMKQSWKWFEIQIQNRLGVIWVLFKLFFSKNKLFGNQGKMIPYNIKLEESKFEIILVF